MTNDPFRQIRQLANALAHPPENVDIFTVKSVDRASRTAVTQKLGSTAATSGHFASQDLCDEIAQKVKAGFTPAVQVQGTTIIGYAPNVDPTARGGGTVAAAAQGSGGGPGQLPIPAWPSSGAVIGGVGQVIVNWNPLVGAQITGFQVRAIDATGTPHVLTVGVGIFSALITNLAPGVCQCQVQTMGNGTASPFSDIQTAVVTADIVPPNPPTNLQASWNDDVRPSTDLLLKWDAPAVIASDWHGYVLHIRDAGAAITATPRYSINLTGFPSTFTYTFLQNTEDGGVSGPSANLQCDIASVDTTGNQSAWLSVQATYPLPVPPNTPTSSWNTDLKPAADLTVSFPQPDHYPAFIGYHVRISSGAPGYATLERDFLAAELTIPSTSRPVDAITYTLAQNRQDSATPNNNLQFVITSKDVFGLESASVTLVCTYPAPIAPTTLTNNWTTDADPSPDLTVSFPQPNHAPAFYAYHVQVLSGAPGYAILERDFLAAEFTVPAATRPIDQIVYTLSQNIQDSAVPNSNLRMTVASRDVFGAESTAATITCTYPEPPATPTALTGSWATETVPQPDLRVGWTVPARVHALTSYDVQYCNSDATLRRTVNVGLALTSTYTLQQNRTDSTSGQPVVLVRVRANDVFGQQSAWATATYTYPAILTTDVAPKVHAPTTAPTLSTIFRSVTASWPVPDIRAASTNLQTVGNGLSGTRIFQISPRTGTMTFSGQTGEQMTVSYQYIDWFDRVTVYSPTATIGIGAADLGYQDLAQMEQVVITSNNVARTKPELARLYDGDRTTAAFSSAPNGEIVTYTYPFARQIVGIAFYTTANNMPVSITYVSAIDGLTYTLGSNSTSDHTVTGTTNNMILRSYSGNVASTVSLTQADMQNQTTNYYREYRFGDTNATAASRKIQSIDAAKISITLGGTTAIPTEILILTYEAAQIFTGRSLYLSDGITIASTAGAGFTGTTGQGYTFTPTAISGYDASGTEVGRLDASTGALWWTKGGFGGSLVTPAVALATDGMYVQPGGSIRSGATGYLSGGNGWWMESTAGGTPRFRIGAVAGGNLTSGIAFDGTATAFVGEGSGVTNINGANIQTGTITVNQLLVAPGSGNLLTNSSFETGTGYGWTASGSNATWLFGANPSAWHGGYCFATQTSTTAGYALIQHNTKVQIDRTKPYVLSGYFRVTTGTPVTNTYLRAWAYDSTGAAISGGPWYASVIPGYLGTTAAFNVTSSAWERRAGVFAANSFPATTTQLMIECYPTYQPPVAVTNVQVDALQFEQGTVPSPWQPMVQELLPGTIQGIHISAFTTIIAGSGDNIAALDGTANLGSYRIYAGNATGSSAPFRVDQLGAMTATNANVTGTITATSGTISGTMNVTGSLIAGGGNVTLDSNGINLAYGTAQSNQVTWQSGGTTRGYISVGASGGYNEAGFIVTATGSTNTTGLYIQNQNNGTGGYVFIGVDSVARFAADVNGVHSGHPDDSLSPGWKLGTYDSTTNTLGATVAGTAYRVATNSNSGWITPTLINSWVAVGSVAYAKDAMGVVHLRGRVKSGTAGVTIFTLPVGYRPAQGAVFPSLFNNGGADSPCNVIVNTDGTVTTSTTSSAYNLLDQVSFATY